MREGRDASTGRYLKIIDSMDCCVWETDPANHLCSFVSGPTERMFGYPRAQWLREPGMWLRITHPEDRDRVVTESAAGLASGRPHRLDFRMVRADGRAIWVRSWVSVVEDGGTRRVRGFTTDVTAEKDAQERLEQACAREAAILRAVPLTVYSCTPDSSFVLSWMGPNVRELTGFTAEEFVRDATLWPSRLHPEDLERVDREMEHFLDRGTFDCEYRWRRADGEYRWFMDRATLRRDAAGKPVEMIGTWFDITERKEAEEALRASEERFRTLADQAPAGIFLTDAAGKAVYLNDTCYVLTGLTPEQAAGDGWVTALDPEDRGRIVAEWRACFSEGREFRTEYRYRHRNGDVRWVSGRAVPLRDAKGRVTGFLGTVTDITELKRGERLKNEFVSMVSHELRTPLTSIRGSLKLVAGGVTGALTPKAKGLVDIAHDSCERLVHLVNDILDIGRIESGKMAFRMEACEAEGFLEKAVQANAGYAQSFGVELRILRPVPPGRVVADPGRLIQVLTNLISNAAKFSPRGEGVEISVRRIGRNLRFAVRDRGPGVPEEFLPRLFQKFAQADASETRPRQGSGLGLSIAKALVEKMEGSLGFESGSDAGATFYFDLPEDLPAPAAPPRLPDCPCVLVCEDDLVAAAILRQHLYVAGFNSEVAPAVAEARESLRQGGYAGMTLDLSLADQDGMSFVRELRSDPRTASLPVVIVSGCVEEGGRVLEGDDLGIVAWLEKPVDPRRFREAVAAFQSHVGRGGGL